MTEMLGHLISTAAVDHEAASSGRGLKFARGFQKKAIGSWKSRSIETQDISTTDSLGPKSTTKLPISGLRLTHPQASHTSHT